MKSRWDDGDVLRTLTPELEDRLYTKLYNICEALLDIRDEIFEVHNSLNSFVNKDKAQAYCLRMLRQVDTPIRVLRRDLAQQRNKVITPATSRVKKEIIELLRSYQF